MRFLKLPEKISSMFDFVPDVKIRQEEILVDGVSQVVLSSSCPDLDQIRSSLISDDFSIKSLLSSGNMNAFKPSIISPSGVQVVDQVSSGFETLNNLVNSVES